MQNKPIHLQLRNRDQHLKTAGDANGPVTSYKLGADELAYYRNMRPPTDASGKPLRRPTNGGGVA